MFDIVIDDMPFDDVESISFDCRILDVKRKNGKNYFAVLPISSLEYRTSNPNRLSSKNIEGSVFKFNSMCEFEIYDDWREVHRICINIKFKDVILSAIAAGKKQGIIRESNNVEL